MSVESPEKRDRDLLHVFIHDLKAPLSAFTSFVDLVNKAGDVNTQQQLFLDKALRSADRMDHIIKRLLEYAYIDLDAPLDKADCDIVTMIHDAVAIHEPMAGASQVSMYSEISPDVSTIPGDEYLLNHVLSNLLSNAIKYNKENGKVWVRANRQSSSLRVDVQDTGIGIPEKDLDKVFDRFYRVQQRGKKIEGSGIGLALAKTVIQRHGGRIWVESKVGEGSTFSFTLPYAEQRPNSGNQFAPRHHESPSEPADDVDDNIQEDHESGEDSPRDEI